MTDKKLTDNEIIKALEVCSDGKIGNEDCINCPYNYIERERPCCDCLMLDALDLITYQKIEIERLQKEVNLVSIQFQDLQERYEEAQAEIERLKQRNAVCEAANRCIVWQRDRRDREIEELHSQIAGLNIYKSKIKAEAYKEFEEKLKKKCYEDFEESDEMLAPYVTEDNIDEILKEMVGENNAEEKE